MPRNSSDKPDMAELHEAIIALAAAFNTNKTAQDQRHDHYLSSFQSLQDQLDAHKQTIQTSPSSFLTQSVKPPKLHLQPFDGSNSLEWIFQANRFFTHYSISPSTAPPSYFLLHGRWCSWVYQWMHHNGFLSTWEEFTHALFKLQQITTVTDYQRNFGRLCDRVIWLPPSAILDCFLSGLKSEIQYEMAIFQPTSISQGIGLAKLIE